MRAVVFPGQGTQRTGMGQRFHHLSAGARTVYERAGEVLGRDVADLCFRGRPETLKDTRNAQVAVVVTNLAAHELLVEAGQPPDVVAGHSVGELSALVAAGSLELDDGLRAVERRAALMAAVETPGTMAAIVGLSPERVRALCDAQVDDVVVPAVFNGDLNTVVSGAVAGVTAVCDAARDEGARATQLEVSHAFHSPLMASVVEAWRDHVESLAVRDSAIPVVMNVSARVATDQRTMRAAMVDQVTGAVRWRESMATLRALGVQIAIEAGDSKVLTGLARGMADGVRTVTLTDPRIIGDVRRAAGLR